MSYRHTLEAALESLQDIEELIKGFPESGDVPTIELDLSLQKLRNIYELLLVLKRPADLPADQPSLETRAAAAPDVDVPVSAPVAAPVSAPVAVRTRFSTCDCTRFTAAISARFTTGSGTTSPCFFSRFSSAAGSFTGISERRAC